MKIRPLTPEYAPKAAALLLQAFAPGKNEVQLFDALHEKERELHEWVCIHRDSVVAYVCFSPAFDGNEICGLHLAPLAVKPQMQGQSIGSELLRFALRQEQIREKTIFVLGKPAFYQKFGFEPCEQPTCPFAKNNAGFLGLRNTPAQPYLVGYLPEFKLLAAPPKLGKKKRR